MYMPKNHGNQTNVVTYVNEQIGVVNVDITNIYNQLVVMKDRIDALEADVSALQVSEADHEARILTLEGFH